MDCRSPYTSTLRKALSLILVSALLPACGSSRSSRNGGPPAPSISGDFNRVALSGDDTSGVEIGRAGTSSFQSIGVYTETSTVNTSGVIGSTTDSGTFSVSVGRALSWINGGGVAHTGGVLNLENVAISSATGASSNPGIAIDLKKGGGSFNNATLSGSYYNVGFAFHPPGNYHYTFTGLLTFDGLGAWSASMTGNTDGTVSGPWTNSGSYSVASDGSVSLTDPAVAFIGGVLAGGDVLILGTFTATLRSEIVVAIRKGGTFSNSSLTGAYRLVFLGSNPPGHHHFSGTGSCSFDGAGVLTWNGTQNTGGSVASVSTVTESYSIAADGTLTITNSGVGTGLTLQGGVLDGGNFAVASAVTSGNRLELRIYMRE